MTEKRLRCRVGLHAYVPRHPEAEQLQGPDRQVCRLCGKRRDTPFGDLPMAHGGGGGAVA